MRLLYISIIVLLSHIITAAQAPFITTWTRLSAGEKITIPVTPGLNCLYSVDWENDDISSLSEYVECYTLDISVGTVVEFADYELIIW